MKADTVNTIVFVYLVIRKVLSEKMIDLNLEEMLFAIKIMLALFLQ